MTEDVFTLSSQCVCVSNIKAIRCSLTDQDTASDQSTMGPGKKSSALYIQGKGSELGQSLVVWNMERILIIEGNIQWQEKVCEPLKITWIFCINQSSNLI